jgi:hypothetical protein
LANVKIISETTTVCWGNFSSFGFVKGRLVCRAKPNVLKCAAGNEKIKNAGRQKFKNIQVGFECRLDGLPPAMVRVYSRNTIAALKLLLQYVLKT